MNAPSTISTQQIPTAAELIARAKALQPTLRERARETEKLGKAHPGHCRGFPESRLLQDVPIGLLGRIRVASGRHFPGAGNAGPGLPVERLDHGRRRRAQLAARAFSKKAQEEVWGADAKVLLSSSYAPTGTVKEVEGGCVLSGRWYYSSGVDHVDWVLLGGNHPDRRALSRTIGPISFPRGTSKSSKTGT